jgi:hypothetical protein
VNYGLPVGAIVCDFMNIGGVIMCDTELVVRATLCLSSGEFSHFNEKIISSLREQVLWCVVKAQKIIHLFFIKKEDYYV